MSDFEMGIEKKKAIVEQFKLNKIKFYNLLIELSGRDFDKYDELQDELIVDAVNKSESKVWK